MIETESHIFVHLLKCGGTSIFRMMMDNFKVLNVDQIGKGVPLSHYTIPIEEKKGKVVVGNIRHPLSFYVSLWAFVDGGFTGTFIKQYKDKAHLCDDTFSIPKFQEWLKIIINDRFLLPPAGEEFNIGILTWTFFEKYYNNDYRFLNTPNEEYLVDHYIRLETLEEDFNRIFGTDIKKQNNPRYKTTKHLPYIEYYNNELIDLVYDKEKFIFDKFNYNKPIL